VRQSCAYRFKEIWVLPDAGGIATCCLQDNAYLVTVLIPVNIATLNKQFSLQT
jgi:hypothetical protein